MAGETHTDVAQNWELTLERLPGRGTGQFTRRVVNARHKPTGHEILLFVNEQHRIERARRHESCPRELLDEVYWLFPDCLRRYDA